MKLTKEDIQKYATEDEKKILTESEIGPPGNPLKLSGKMREIDIEPSEEGVEKYVPKEVRISRFGCINCLWSDVECKNGSMYLPYNYDGKISCKNYTYYD